MEIKPVEITPELRFSEIAAEPMPSGKTNNWDAVNVFAIWGVAFVLYIIYQDYQWRKQQKRPPDF